MSVKLQQSQRNYRLRNHFGMRVASLTPRSKVLKQGKKAKFDSTIGLLFLKSLGIDCGSRK